MLDVDAYTSLQERALNLTTAIYRITDFFPKTEVLRNHLRAKANEIFELVTEYTTDADNDREARIILQKIRTIKGYLTIVGTLDYVRPLNFVILQKEYTLIERYFEEKRGGPIADPLRKDEFRPALMAKHLVTIEKMKESAPVPMENINASVSGNVFEAHAEIARIETMHYKGIAKTSSDSDMVVDTGRILNKRQKTIMEHLQKAGSAKVSDFFDIFHTISSKTIQRDLQGLVEMQMLKKEGEKRWTLYSLCDTNMAIKDIISI